MLSRKDQPLSGAIALRHASHPNRSFNELQRIADFAGPHAATFAAGSAGPGADARACWHAAALAVRRGPRASWGTGRDGRNWHKKFSAAATFGQGVLDSPGRQTYFIGARLWSA